VLPPDPPLHAGRVTVPPPVFTQLSTALLISFAEQLVAVWSSALTLEAEMTRINVMRKGVVKDSLFIYDY
jgi:hypothetical protein